MYVCDSPYPFLNLPFYLFPGLQPPFLWTASFTGSASPSSNLKCPDRSTLPYPFRGTTLKLTIIVKYHGVLTLLLRRVDLMRSPSPPLNDPWLKFRALTGDFRLLAMYFPKFSYGFRPAIQLIPNPVNACAASNSTRHLHLSPSCRKFCSITTHPVHCPLESNPSGFEVNQFRPILARIWTDRVSGVGWISHLPTASRS
ncbi:hypothetical protein C8F04DRAFT_266415 [Mycena alexandri]|uniref:Uncharacterized protein n=1 Tax=Mycena alexandri TaxID=1745969 RepID=A0AAD6T7A7_9AGAR|nr:hypothetical protein C8F04DRAFT_266415 [Mycena alexandri]